MNEWNAETRWRLALLSMLVVGVSLLPGCENKPDEQLPPPPPPPAFSVVVSPAMLNKWVTSGYGTDENGYNKMVVLDVAAPTATAPSPSYSGTGHVPGAFLLNAGTEVSTSRDDGMGGTYSYTDPVTGAVSTAINAVTEVATAAMMNPVIQRTAIDANTVIVLTGDSLMSVAMAYFNFRYWGFPRERLRVLDRTNAEYAKVDTSYTLETTTPTAPTPSTYSVCNLIQNTWLRATLSDMIQVAEGNVPNVITWDVRKPTEYAGDANQTMGPFGTKSGNFTAFEGHIKGAVNLEYNDPALLTGAGAILSDAATMKTTLAGRIGVAGDETTYVYCRTAGRASVAFLMLDGVLGYTARLYDASWIEWGNMALFSDPLVGGLAADSPWRTDRADRSAAIRYNTNVDVLTGADSYAAGTDLVNMTDASPVCLN